MNTFNKIKNFIFTVIPLLLWLHFCFVFSDPEMAKLPTLTEGLPVFDSWRGFLNSFYAISVPLMWPVNFIYGLLRGFVPPTWNWLPSLDSVVLLKWLQGQAALKSALPMLYQPDVEQIFAGRVQWLMFLALVFYNLLNIFIDQMVELFKNLIWNVLIEFSFTKKKQNAYQQTLEKRAADLMKLKVEYRNLSKENSVLAESVITDELTKLFNKRFFIQRVQDEFNEAKQKRALFSIVMVDIDHFKKLNDTYGHLMGDKVLKEVAALVKKHTPKDSYACRFGGEEFSVIMPNKNPADAMVISKAIHESIPQLRFNDPNLKVTISLGLLCADFKNPEAQAMSNFEDAIKLADDELYRAKLNGRNRIEQVQI